MATNLLIFALILCSWSCAEKSVQLLSKPVTPIQTSEKIQQSVVSVPDKKFDYTFEQLHGVANYATVVFSRRINDQIEHKKSPQIFKCDPSDDEINIWTMQLKSLIDEQAAYVEQKILTDHSYLDKFANCEKNCMCGEYVSILKNFNSAQLNDKQLMQLSEMDRKFKAQTDQQMLACAKKMKKFCGSQLHRLLRKMSEE